jgi:hypothetical protein
VRRIGVLLGSVESDPLWKPDVSAFTQTLAWVGPMAARCGWTFIGPAVMPIGYEQQNSKRPSSPLGASREAALCSCRIYSRWRIAERGRDRIAGWPIRSTRPRRRSGDGFMGNAEITPLRFRQHCHKLQSAACASKCGSLRAPASSCC